VFWIGHRKNAADVFVAGVGVQPGLRHGGAHPAKTVSLDQRRFGASSANGAASQPFRQAPCQQFRLVVASLVLSVAVERNWQDDGRAPEAWPNHASPEGTQEFSELSAQPFAMVKFQLQYSSAKVSGVEAKAARKIEGVFLAPTLGAKRIARFYGPFAGERKTTSGAQGSSPGSKVLPASAANTGPSQPIELFSAEGAIRRKDDSKQTVDKLMEEGRGMPLQFL
jgi:hypothetical protein